MPPVGFETTILVSERPQTHALDRAATAIGLPNSYPINILSDELTIPDHAPNIKFQFFCGNPYITKNGSYYEYVKLFT
jgi:hypothetical protein